MQSCRIHVTGVVQGVGFRPFVWRLAQELNLAGWVRNNPAGVEIAAEGDGGQLQALLRRLRDEAPPLARVDDVQAQPSAPQALRGFTIEDSDRGRASTSIGPDVATCPACLEDLFDPAGRRWRHPFVTCTHCGPRFSVTRGLPYDRPQTSLAGFALCPACAAEYGAPADRRFHAETICCPQCGPALALREATGAAVAGDPIAHTLERLRAGAIVAILGLGGYHLACDATNPVAVARLRQRKQREAKPFAVMAANVEDLRAWVEVSDAEQRLLEASERPVVVLDAPAPLDDVLPGVAPGLATLGAMLPVTPIQYLLFHEAAGRPAGTEWLGQPQPLLLVMTSANPGGEPLVRTRDEARQRLAGLADAFLDHDREVVARCDDSVVRMTDGAPRFLRRARGYAPQAVALRTPGPSVLAFGSHLKNTACLTRGSEAFVSPHVGDLDNAASCSLLDETVQRLCVLLDTAPAAVAHDLHPDDYGTRAATRFAQRHGLPAYAVQHHHAHVAAVLAEHGVAEPVLGLALDGTGLGSDGTAWGGELLRVDGAHFERLGHLRCLPLPGGDRAARQPWRMGAAVLHALGQAEAITEHFAEQPQAAAVADLLARGLHCPPTSSLGRVFDAVAGLSGVCPEMRYEAQAAMLLEQAAWAHVRRHGLPAALPGAWGLADGELDLLPLLASLQPLPDAGTVAAVFHATLVAALADWTLQAVERTGLRSVALAGGCFLNRLLATGLQQRLRAAGLRVLAARRFGPGDGSISLGQAWVARQRATGSP